MPTLKKEDIAFYAYEKIALHTVLEADAGDYLGEEGVIDLMKRISQSYGMRTPAFKRTRKDSTFCYYRRSDHAVYYNVLWGLNSKTVLHEMAHAVHHHLGTGGSIHGKEFLRIWMDMASRMYSVHVEELEILALDKKLVFTERYIEAC